MTGLNGQIAATCEQRCLEGPEAALTSVSSHSPSQQLKRSHVPKMMIPRTVSSISAAPTISDIVSAPTLCRTN